MKCRRCGAELVFLIENFFIANGTLVIECEECEETISETELRDIEKIYWEVRSK